jgi:hypothetical protein
MLGAGLFALGALVVGHAVLGPLVFDALRFRTSASGVDQIRGVDLAAVAIVGWCEPHRRRRGPIAWRPAAAPCSW